MSSSVTISGVISPYMKKDGTRQIKLRITYKRKVRYLPTNLFAYPSQLNKKGEIKDSSLRMRINALELQMYEKIRETNLLDSLSMDVDQVIGILTAPEEDVFHMDVIKHFDTYSEGRKPNTKGMYQFAKRWLIKYLNRDHIDITEIDVHFLDDMVAALRSHYGERARSVSLIYSSLVTICTDIRKKARRSGYKIDNVFEDYDVPRKPKHKNRDIPHELIQEIIDKRRAIPYKAQREALDIFLLSFALFGMNLIDMYTCAPPQKGVIHFSRTKVRDTREDEADVYVRIPQCIRKLYDRYADPTGKRAFRFYLQQPDYRLFYINFASSMRRATKNLGHPGEFTFYSARHSFATLNRSNGADKGIVNDCLGHVDPDMKITDIYIRKDWTRHQEENEKLLATFDWTNL